MGRASASKQFLNFCCNLNKRALFLVM
ncbi:UNVERIFIED_CONTAM: hypothetical protein NCL1_50325 [Trichonephila clavipes]